MAADDGRYSRSYRFRSIGIENKIDVKKLFSNFVCWQRHIVGRCVSVFLLLPFWKNVLSFLEKRPIFFGKMSYRFYRNVLSFLLKRPIVFTKTSYRFEENIRTFLVKSPYFFSKKSVLFW